METPNYIGKVVFVESKGTSSYHNGEYIIVEQSPNNLYGIKPEGGYGGHDLKTFPLFGKEAYEVIRVTDDPTFIRRIIQELRYFADTKKRGEKGNWIDSVYTGAANNADKLERVLCPCAPATKTQAAESRTVQMGGVKVTVSVEPA